MACDCRCAASPYSARQGRVSLCAASAGARTRSRVYSSASHSSSHWRTTSMLGRASLLSIREIVVWDTPSRRDISRPESPARSLSRTSSIASLLSSRSPAISPTAASPARSPPNPRSGPPPTRSPTPPSGPGSPCGTSRAAESAPPRFWPGWLPSSRSPPPASGAAGSWTRHARSSSDPPRRCRQLLRPAPSIADTPHAVHCEVATAPAGRQRRRPARQ